MGEQNKEKIVYEISAKVDAQTTKAFANIQKQSSRVTNGMKNISNSYQKTTKAGQRFGYKLQNVSYQVADFFVMIQGGISPMRALSTQLPQLLAGFGVLGAALGAVAAVGASVIVMMQQQEKVVIDFTEALKESEEAQKNVNEATKQFIANGGAYNRAVLDSAKAIQALKAENLEEALRPPDIGLFKAYWVTLKNVLSDIGSTLASSPYFKAFQIILEPIGKLFGVINDELNKFKASVQGDLDLEDPIRKASNEFAKIIGAAERGETYLANMTGEMYKFRAEAIRLLDLNVFDEFAVAGGTKAAMLESAYANAYAQIKALGNAATDDQKAALEALEKAARDAKAEFAEFAKEYEQLSDLTIYTELEQQINRYDRALEELVISQERYNELVAAAKNADFFKPLQEAMLDFGEQFEDTIIKGLKEGKLAFEDFASYAIEQLARIALSRVLDPLWNSLANLIPTFGGAAPTAGTTGIIETAAPGAIRASAAVGSISPVSVVAAMKMPTQSYGGNQGVQVNVNNYGNDEVEVQERKTSRGVEIDVLIKSAVNKGLAGGDFDNAMRASYGAQRLAF